MVIADLGEAKQLASETLRRTQGTRGVGTPLYMAPEMMAAEEYRTVQVDMFSLGVMIAEMSSGRAPNPGPPDTGRRDPSGRRVLALELERRASDVQAMRHPSLRAIVQRCLSENPVERPTSSTLPQRIRALDANALSAGIAAIELS